MSVNKANTSELELLRQRIRELEAENAEMPDLRRKISEFDAEKTELKHRIAEALKMTEEERTRRDAENAKHKARIEELESEFRDRIMKVEQKQTLNDNSSNNNSSNFNLVADQVPMVTITRNHWWILHYLNGRFLG
jgi:predicted RNase H-like nuclease (RuvC/YqgF family)